MQPAPARLAEGGEVEDPYTDATFWENPDLVSDWALKRTHFKRFAAPHRLPDDVEVGRFASDEAMREIRLTKNLFSMDVVIATRMPDGTPAVLLSKRKPTEGFGEKWWIYGGSPSAYAHLMPFLAKRAQRECGVPVEPEALIGFYYTSADDHPQSTAQPCYATLVPYEAVVAKMSTDPNHESVNVFTAADLKKIPEAEQHWYPLHVARRALSALAQM